MPKDMTTGNATKHILWFTVPMLIGNVFQQAYNMLDAVVVGQYNGLEALAAVGASFSVVMLLIALVLGLALGASIILSQLFGAGKLEELRRAVGTMSIFMIVSGLIISLAGFLLSEPLLRLMKTPENIIPDATLYLKIYFTGIIFVFMYNVISALLRSVGNSKVPLYFIIIAAVINISLDFVFVAGMGMGVAGAALSTVIAQGFSAIGGFAYTFIKVPTFRLNRSHFKFDFNLLKQSIRLGLPSAFQQMLMAVGFLAVQGLVNSYGDLVMAAFTAATRIEQLIAMPITNFGVAISTFAGQNIGAARLDRVRKGFRGTILLSFISCAILSVLVVFFGSWLISIFLDFKDTGINVTEMVRRAEVVRLGSQYLSVTVVFYILFAVFTTSTSMLRGVGDVFYSTLVTLVSFFVRLICAYLLAMTPMGYQAIWWSVPIGWFVGAAMGMYRYKTNKWETKAVA